METRGAKMGPVTPGQEAFVGRVPTADREHRNGTFPNGMDYLSWGNGSKTLLFIQGGPGSTVPRGMLRRMFRRQFDAFLHAGYAVWVVTRRRGMPPEHSIPDMAEDYARLIAEEFRGRVDVVVAESFGGMIGQYLAARHPDSFGSQRVHLRWYGADRTRCPKDRRRPHGEIGRVSRLVVFGLQLSIRPLPSATRRFIPLQRGRRARGRGRRRCRPGCRGRSCRICVQRRSG